MQCFTAPCILAGPGLLRSNSTCLAQHQLSCWHGTAGLSARLRHSLSSLPSLPPPSLPLSVRKGPFRAGQSYSFCGKIIYEECRKPVYTPSDWDPALGERSAELPASRLALEFIYGYTGVLGGRGVAAWQAAWRA